MSDLQAHKCLRLSSEEYQTECWKKAATAWGAILPQTMATDASTVLVEACAAGAGIAAMPSYVSEIEDRLTPLTEIKPLATVRFWLAYTERVRNMEASQPVLHWIRSCFDPVRNPCFREIYVPPQSRARRMEIANDRNPVVSTSANANLRQSISPPHAGDPGDKSDASERVQSLAAGEGGRVRTAMDKG